MIVFQLNYILYFLYPTITFNLRHFSVFWLLGRWKTCTFKNITGDKNVFAPLVFCNKVLVQIQTGPPCRCGCTQSKNMLYRSEYVWFKVTTACRKNKDFLMGGIIL